MRLALTAGGTGGHIYPALSVLAAMRAGDSELAVRFFGPDNRGERALVERHGLAFEAVPSAGIRGRGPLQLAASAARLAIGTVAAVWKLRRFNPDIVFSTGGYASFPCSVASRVLRRPLVVYLPDVTPGWAVRVEQKLATKVATTAEAALAHLPRRKTVVTGYPVRAEFFSMTRGEARDRLNIDPTEKVLLVAGASQGSTAINAAIASGLDALLERARVIHVTGGGTDMTGQVDAAAGEGRPRYEPTAYRDDLPVVMLAADLAIMRAGASVIGELPAAGLPALLVPGTFAGGHQRDNAGWLAAQGAAEVVEERAIDRLVPRALELLGDSARLETMRARARALARPNAAADVAGILREVARR